MGKPHRRIHLFKKTLIGGRVCLQMHKHDVCNQPADICNNIAVKHTICMMSKFQLEAFSHCDQELSSQISRSGDNINQVWFGTHNYLLESWCPLLSSLTSSRLNKTFVQPAWNLDLDTSLWCIDAAYLKNWLLSKWIFISIFAFTFTETFSNGSKLDAGPTKSNCFRYSQITWWTKFKHHCSS